VPKETPAKRQSEEAKQGRESAPELKDAVERASRGDRSALPTIRQRLDTKSDEWWVANDFARMTTRAQIGQIYEDNLFARETLERQVERLKAELSGANPSPLERLLVERIACCRLQVNYAETKNAEYAKAGRNFQASEYYQKRVDRAQQRYIAAIKALAQVRRLLGSSVQVNIAEQQVNVAGR
jgi:hypothetical protein